VFTIALDLGFADNAALYKFIKRHTGLTPTDFREQVRNGSQEWELKKKEINFVYK
jgi:AraC-like DNA-binding protein